MKPTCPFCGYTFDHDAPEGQLYKCQKCKEFFRVGEHVEKAEIKNKVTAVLKNSSYKHESLDGKEEKECAKLIIIGANQDKICTHCGSQLAPLRFRGGNSGYKFVCLQCDPPDRLCPNCGTLLRKNSAEECKKCGASWRKEVKPAHRMSPTRYSPTTYKIGTWFFLIGNLTPFLGIPLFAIGIKMIHIGFEHLEPGSGPGQGLESSGGRLLFYGMWATILGLLLTFMWKLGLELMQCSGYNERKKENSKSHKE